MRHLFRDIGIVIAMCGIVSPLAAQEATVGTTITASAVAAISGPDDSMPAPATSTEAQVTPVKEQRPLGQIGKADPAPPTPPHTGLKALAKALGRDVVHLPSRQNLLWVGIGTGAAFAAHPLDDTANQSLSGTRLNKVFAPGALLGQSYTLLPSAAAVYAVGRISHKPRVSHMGSDLIESVLVAEMMTQSLKHTVGRERPDGSDAYSFPSGHAADTMAFATALERHFSWKFWVPAYAFASYVAVSRVHDNRHYLSDVMAGSAVGIIAGRTVTRHGREHFPIQAMGVPGGMAIMYVR